MPDQRKQRDRGQIEGGFVQGMGWLTMEELWWDEEGRLRTHAPSTYKIPGSRDVPADFRVHILEDSPNAEPTIFRSKAVGEPPLMLAISVWLALRDAVASLSDRRFAVNLDAPATPERVLTAVTDMRERAAALITPAQATEPCQREPSSLALERIEHTPTAAIAEEKEPHAAEGAE